MVNREERNSTVSIVIPSLAKFGLVCLHFEQIWQKAAPQEVHLKGFTGEERELNYRLQCRKILHMEEMMDKLLERI